MRDIELAYVAYGCIHVAMLNARIEGKGSIFIRDTNPYLIELIKLNFDNKCLLFIHDGFWIYI